MYKFLDKCDKLKDHEVLQLIVLAVIVGLGIALLVAAILQPEYHVAR